MDWNALFHCATRTGAQRVSERSIEQANEQKRANEQIKNPYVNHADWNAIWYISTTRDDVCVCVLLCGLRQHCVLYGFSIKFELYEAKENEFVSDEEPAREKKESKKIKSNLIFC